MAYIRSFACDRSLQTIPFEELLNAFCGFLYLLAKKCFFLGKCWMFSPLYRIIFQKHAPFWGSVEYVQFFGDDILKMCFFLGKCWMCSICSIPRERLGEGPQSFPTNWDRSLQTIPFEELLNAFCGFLYLLANKSFFLGKCWMFSPLYRIIFQKHAPFWGNVQYVQFFGDDILKMCFFLGKCWICSICSTPRERLGGAPNLSLGIEHIEHI